MTEQIPSNPRVDIDKAHNRTIVANHLADSKYAPYCMRCKGLQRMRVVKPFLFAHHCGAVHDETQVLQ